MRMHKKAKLFGKIVFYAFFVAVLLIVVGMAFAKFNNQVFFLGDRATIWVITDSMEDQIPAQSYIQIRKIDPSQVQLGDVITFYSDDPTLRGQLNTHRVVEIAEDGKTFVTKGDTNLANDTYPVRREAVVGVYERNLPLMSMVGRVLQSEIGLFCILILMAVLIVFSFVGDSIKKLFRKSKQDSSPDEPT